MPQGPGRVVMFGPPVEGRGGVSAVAAAYRDGGLFERCGVRYLATVGDGGPLRKLLFGLAAWLRFAWWLRPGGGVRVVHGHVSSGISFWRKALFLWTAYLRGVPAVLHVHGGNFAEFFRGSPAWAQRFIRATFARAGAVVVLSEVWIGKLAEVVAAERCTVIRNPVAEWPLPARQRGPVRRFLFLGRLEAAKGVWELLEAFAQVHRQFPDARLVLAGEGQMARVRERLAALGVADVVELPGWISGEAKLAALNTADAFVLPSHIEGLPISMLEAMHCGMPVVVSAVGSVPEVLVDGENGLMVPAQDAQALADALLRLAGEPALAERLGLQGRETFNSRYGMRTIGLQVARLFEALADQTGANSLNRRGRGSDGI